MPRNYDAIVIGSGLGGLTAGALYARTGAKVLLLERNHSFGGAATTYQRGQLTVEASLHETSNPLAGPDQKGAVLEALDLMSKVEFVPIDHFQEVRCPLIGKPLIVPHGHDAIERALTERFPDQDEGIRDFLRQIRRTQQAIADMGADHTFRWFLERAVDLPLELWAVLRDLKSSLSEVLERYFGDDEAIKLALAGNLPYFTDDPDTFWWLGFVMAQGGYFQSGGSYIKGGSQTLSNHLARIIREEGGETLTGCEAVGVDLGPNGEAAGVRYRSLSDGTETAAQAPVIFANAAPHLIGAMLPQARQEEFLAPYKDRPLSISLLSATFALNRRPSEFGVNSYSTLLIPGWMKRLSDYQQNARLLSDTPGEKLPALAVVDYSYIDSGLSDGGVFPLNVVCTDQLENWEGLSDDAYHEKRDAWTDAIVARLDKEWPGIASAIGDRTVATARTMHQYLNTPGGAIYGFALRPPEDMPKGPPINPETPIKGLWLASAFGGAGGFNGSILTGASAARAALAEAHAGG